MRGSTAIRILHDRASSEGRPRLAIVSCTGNASPQGDHLLTCADLVWNKPFPSAEDGTMQRDIAKLLPHLVKPVGDAAEHCPEAAWLDRSWVGASPAE
jgi:hypothetical protein